MAQLQIAQFDTGPMNGKTGSFQTSNNFQFKDNGVTVSWPLTNLPKQASNYGFPTDTTSTPGIFKSCLTPPSLYNGYPVVVAMVGQVAIVLLVPVGAISGGDINFSGSPVGLTCFIATSQVVVDANFSGLSSSVLSAAVQVGYNAKGMVAV